MRKDVGVDGDAQRIGQLTWLLFLKVFDDREREAEAIEDRFRSPIPANLRWRNWAANPEGITGEPLTEFVNLQLLSERDTDHKKRASCDRLERARRGCLVHRLLGEAILKPFPSLSGSCNGMMGQRRLAPSFSSPWQSNSQAVSFPV